MIDVPFWPTANGLEIAILLEELELPHRLLPVDIRAGEQHAANQASDPRMTALQPSTARP